jgi:hypothetical protein
LKERLEKIKTLSQEKSPNLEFLRAYIGCLSDEETKDLLINVSISDIKLRELVLKKLDYDLEGGLGIEHKKIIRELIKLAKKSEYKEELSIAYCLTRLLPHTKGNDQALIIKFFLNSKRISFRNRAYKYLADNFKKSYYPLVLSVWEKYKDYRAVIVIINNFDSEYLYDNRALISSHIRSGWLMGKLYIRIGKIKPEAIEELFSYDIKTYCYCLAKLNLQLPSIHSKSISCSDDNGLLLWSLGRIKEWNLIEKLESEFNKKRM